MNFCYFVAAGRQVIKVLASDNSQVQEFIGSLANGQQIKLVKTTSGGQQVRCIRIKLFYAALLIFSLIRRVSLLLSYSIRYVDISNGIY